MKEWRLEDNIKTKIDLIRYMEAVLGEYQSSFLPQNHDNPDNAFEYFLIACKDVLRIAKDKGWINDPE